MNTSLMIKGKEYFPNVFKMLWYNNHLRKYETEIIYIFILLLMIIMSTINYLLYHSLVELFSIFVAWSIVILTWNTRKFNENNFLLFIGIAYFFIGLVDLLHTLAYANMGVFPNYDSNLPTQLWIVARYIESLSLLFAFLLTERKIDLEITFGVYFLVTGTLVILIFSRIFPAAYIEGSGLTNFKIISEYIIIIFLILAIIVLFRKRIYFEEKVFQLLVLSLFLTIGSEFSFSNYVSVFGFFNMIGHLAKLISFYLLYRAIVVTSLFNPYDILFKNLKLSKEEVQRERDSLIKSNAELIDKQKKIDELNQSLIIMNSILRHDLLNNLTNIKMALDLFENHDNSLESFQLAKNATNHGIKLIETMKNYSSLIKSEEELIETNIKEIILDVVKGYENFPLELTLEEDCIVRADSGLFSAIDNLIRNAIQHSQTQKIDIIVRRANKCCEIKIKDYGVGIPDNQKSKIFEPGIRFSEKGQLGLGLYIVKSVIDRYGGKIFVEDNVPQGTTFSLNFC